MIAAVNTDAAKLIRVIKRDTLKTKWGASLSQTRIITNMGTPLEMKAFIQMELSVVESRKNFNIASYRLAKVEQRCKMPNWVTPYTTRKPL